MQLTDYQIKAIKDYYKQSTLSLRIEPQQPAKKKKKTHTFKVSGFVMGVGTINRYIVARDADRADEIFRSLYSGRIFGRVKVILNNYL